MAKAKKGLKLAGTDVGFAEVAIDTQASHQGFNQTELRLYAGVDTHAGKTFLAKIGFQRHRLHDERHHGIARVEEMLPDPDFDFGAHTHPWTHFYAATVADSSIRAEAGGIITLKRYIDLISKVTECIQKYNYAPIHKDELKLWMVALEKFGIQTRVTRYHNGREFEFMGELETSAQRPGRKYLEILKGQD